MLKKNRAKHLRVTDQSSKEQTIAKCTDARYLLGCTVLLRRRGEGSEGTLTPLLALWVKEDYKKMNKFDNIRPSPPPDLKTYRR